VKTEDGKILKETRDAKGNYSSVVTNQHQYGFIADVAGDFQVGEIRHNLIMGIYCLIHSIILFFQAHVHLQVRSRA